jgi:hypothetical protein
MHLDWKIKSLALILIFSACQKKEKIKLSAWQTCEYIMPKLIENQLDEESKFFYINPSLEEEIKNKIPSWQKNKKQAKGVYSIEYLTEENAQNTAESQKLPTIFSTAPCICRYLYLIDQIPFLIDLSMTQHQSDDWKIDGIVEADHQESLLKLIDDQGLASTEFGQKSEIGFYGIDKNFKTQSTLVIAISDEMIAVDGKSLKIPINQIDAQIPTIMVQIEKAFAWRERLGNLAQSRYQRKIAFALPKHQPYPILKTLFKLSFLSKSEGLSLIVKNKHQNLTMLALATPDIEKGDHKKDFYLINAPHFAELKVKDQKLIFQFSSKGKQEELILATDAQGQINAENLIQILSDLKAKIVNSFDSYGLLISLQSKQSIDQLSYLLDQIQSIDPNIKISIDLRDEVQ